MKTTIESETRIGAVTMFAELAVWRKRRDLQALCLCAAASEDGVLDEDAVEKVLPGLSARACKNILRRMQHDRLVDRQHRLTEFGESCASDGDAPAWEEGVYRFLVAEHELVGVHVLDFERDDPHAKSIGQSKRDDVPNGVAMPRERMFVSAFDPNLRFGLAADSVAGNRQALRRIERMPAATLRWEIDLESGENECIVEGRIRDGAWRRSGAFRSAAEEPALRSELTGLFAQWEPRWEPRRNAGRGLVAMEYDGGVGPDGQETFLREFAYEPVRVGRFGEFARVVVRDVPVGPAKPADAREWAEAIAVARVKSQNGYVTRDGWRSEWSNAIRGAPLAEWAGFAPDPATLAAALGGAGAARTKWLLAAAIDLDEATP